MLESSSAAVVKKRDNVCIGDVQLRQADRLAVVSDEWRFRFATRRAARMLIATRHPLALGRAPVTLVVVPYFVTCTELDAAFPAASRATI